MAAEEEFAAKGHEGSSVSSIIARAGVATGTFYMYFESKDDVLRMLMRQLTEALERHFARCSDQASDPAHLQALNLRSYIAFRDQHPSLDRIVGACEWIDKDLFRRHYHLLAENLKLVSLRSPASSEPDSEIGRGINHILRLWEAIMSRDGTSGGANGVRDD